MLQENETQSVCLPVIMGFCTYVHTLTYSNSSTAQLEIALKHELVR